MKYTTTILALALASVKAQDYDQMARRALMPRQTGASGGGLPGALGVDGECLDDAIEFLQSMPTPSPEFLQAMDTPTDEGCYKLPESLDGEFSSYSSAVASFLSDNAEFVSSAEEACAEATLFPAAEFCEGSGPDDRDAANGLKVSLAAIAGAVMVAALAL